jgi:hypothetical protein
MKENCIRSLTDERQNKSIKNEYILIDKSSEYHGLLGFPCPTNLEFLTKDPVYKFPLLSSSESRLALLQSSFYSIHNQEISEAILKFQSKSPFQCLIQTETINSTNSIKKGPTNSLNFCSFYSQFCSRNTNIVLNDHSTNLESSCTSYYSQIEKQEISESQKALIINAHNDFANNKANDLHFQSISLNSLSPDSSISLDEKSSELTPPSIKENPYFASNSSISLINSEEIALTSLNLELSMIE